MAQLDNEGWHSLCGRCHLESFGQEMRGYIYRLLPRHMRQYPALVPGETAEGRCHESLSCRPRRAKKSEDYCCMQSASYTKPRGSRTRPLTSQGTWGCDAGELS